MGLAVGRAHPSVNPTVVLSMLCAASFIATLDVFIVNAAFAAGSSLSDLSFILNGYAIIYAALLVPLGRLADRSGRRTVDLARLTTFTLGTPLVPLAPDYGRWSPFACAGSGGGRSSPDQPRPVA